jgi:hypothetical protein
MARRRIISFDRAPGHRVLADGTGDVSAGKQRQGRAGPGGGR